MVKSGTKLCINIGSRVRRQCGKMGSAWLRTQNLAYLRYILCYFPFSLEFLIFSPSIQGGVLSRCSLTAINSNVCREWCGRCIRVWWATFLWWYAGRCARCVYGMVHAMQDGVQSMEGCVHGNDGCGVAVCCWAMVACRVSW